MSNNPNSGIKNNQSGQKISGDSLGTSTNPLKTDDSELSWEKELGISSTEIPTTASDILKAIQDLGQRLTMMEVRNVESDVFTADMAAKITRVEKRTSKSGDFQNPRIVLEQPKNVLEGFGRKKVLPDDEQEEDDDDSERDVKDTRENPESNKFLEMLESRRIQKSSDKFNAAAKLSDFANSPGNDYSGKSASYLDVNNNYLDERINGNPFQDAFMDSNFDRRYSVTRMPKDTSNVPKAQTNSTNVMVTPYEIKEEDKMKFITLKSIKRLMEQYAVFRASSLDNTKTLIFFINYDCQMKLINKQMLLDTPLAKHINPQNIFLVKDKCVEDMLSDYIRPTSRDDFVIQFSHAMTHPTWRKELEFNTVNYYKHIFPHITVFLEECEIYDKHLRRGADAVEIMFMPKLEWGKNDPGGMFRIAMAVLHPYQENFIELLGEDNLKVLRSMKEFIKYFGMKNTEISKMSLKITRQNQVMQKPASYSTIAAQARKKSDDYKDYKTNATKASSPQKKKFTHYVKNRLNEIEGIEFDFPPEEFIVDISDDSGDDPDMTEEEFNQKWDNKLIHKESVSKELRNWDKSEVELALNALCAIQPTYAPRRNHDGIKIYQAKPVNTKEQVCFGFAFGKCEAGSACVYSHDLAKTKTFLDNSYKRLLSAPAWDPKIVAEAGTARTPLKSDQDKQSNNRSNHGGGHGRGAAQSPATNQRTSTPYSNNYGKNYIIVEEKSIGNTENKSSDLPSTEVKQPFGAENHSGSSRSPSTSGGRDDPEC